jgi:hypothetical protein
MSSATRPFSAADLINLLHKARINNTRLNVTGMLLYKEGNFLQLLEGEEQVVMDLYEFIKTNTDHHSATILDKTEISERLFGDWSMGFHNLQDEAVQALPGYNQFMNTAFTLETFADDPNGCLDLLKLFRDHM